LGDVLAGSFEVSGGSVTAASTVGRVAVQTIFRGSVPVVANSRPSLVIFIVFMFI